MSALTSFHKTLMIVLSSLWLTSGQAETPKAKTLGDMVKQAKHKQALGLNPPPEPKVAAVNKKPVSLPPPMLWTLTGVNNRRALCQRRILQQAGELFGGAVVVPNLPGLGAVVPLAPPLGAFADKKHFAVVGAEASVFARSVE